MVYVTNHWRCTYCGKTIRSMGIASHMRGKKHIENMKRAKENGQLGSIYRID